MWTPPLTVPKFDPVFAGHANAASFAAAVATLIVRLLRPRSSELRLVIRTIVLCTDFVPITLGPFRCARIVSA